MVLRDDVLSSQISTKLALIGQLVRAPLGRKHRWNAENRPCWWPLQSFGSPNFGATRLSASDADTVLLACRDFISQADASMSENENADADDDIVDAMEVGAMDVQEVSRHVDREGSEVLAQVVEERCSLDIEREECVVEGRSEDIHGESRADGRECEQSVECLSVERVGAGALPSSSRDADDSEQHDKSVVSDITAMCKDFKWNPEEAKLFLDSVPPVVNGDILEALIEVLPMSMPMKHLPAADVEIDAWFQHQIPDAMKGYVPINVNRGGNSLFHAVSIAQYGSSVFWPCIRLCCAKYGLQRLRSVISKLKKLESNEEILLGLLGIAELSDENLKDEIARTIINGRATSILHLVLLSEALGVTINCNFVSPSIVRTVEHRYPINDVHLLWTSDPNSPERSHICPLVCGQPLAGKYDVMCAAGALCAMSVDVNPGQEKVQCCHCMRPYHLRCIGVGLDDIKQSWSCCCNFKREHLLRNQKYGFSTLQNLIQGHKPAIQKYLRGILKKTVFSWHMHMYWQEKTEDLRQAKFRCRWFFKLFERPEQSASGNNNTLIEQTSVISHVLQGLRKVDIDDKIFLNIYVFPYE
eukprot:gene13093-14436_t